MNNFESVVDLHLKSITERNFSSFSEFFHPSHSCIVILPNGNMIEGNADILDFHKEWFKEMDWRIEYQKLNIFANGNVGYALFDITYFDIEQNGSPYELKYLLSLLFINVDNKWVLIRDQNTLK